MGVEEVETCNNFVYAAVTSSSGEEPDYEIIRSQSVTTTPEHSCSQSNLNQ